MDPAKASQLIEVPTTVWNRPFYRGVRIFFSLFCRSYLRLNVDGLESLPMEGGTIVAVNHQSHLDVPLMGLAMPREARFPGKAELFTSSFLLRTFLLNLGGFPIVRGEGDRKAISLSESILQRGDVLVLFPEGTRTRSGEISTFHRGLGVLSIRTGSPIVPAAIKGSGNSLGVGKAWHSFLFQFHQAPDGPGPDICPEKNFQGRIRQDHGSDISSVHHDSALFAQTTLDMKQIFPHTGNLGNSGSYASNFFAAQKICHVFPIQENARAVVLDGIGNASGLKGTADVGLAGFRQIGFLQRQCHGPVKRTGIGMNPLEFMGEGSCQRGFSGGGGSVDRNGSFFQHSTT